MTVERRKKGGNDGGVGNFGCPSCGPGGLGAYEGASESAWLATGSIPWYSVSNGQLYLEFGYWLPNPNYDPNTPLSDPSSVLGEQEKIEVDLGSISASDNGSWVQQILNYLQSVPWTLTLIASTPEQPIGPAFTMAYNPKTKFLCGGGGLGASVGRNFSLGPLVVGNLHNQNSILSGASISAGFQVTPLLGGQLV